MNVHILLNDNFDRKKISLRGPFFQIQGLLWRFLRKFFLCDVFIVRILIRKQFMGLN